MAKFVSAALVFAAMAVFLVNGHHHFTGHESAGGSTSGDNVKDQSRSLWGVRDNAQGATHVSNGVSEKQLGKSSAEGVAEGQGSGVETQNQKGKESLDESQGSYVQESSSGQEVSSGGGVDHSSMSQGGQGQWEQQQQHDGEFGHGPMHNNHHGGWKGGVHGRH